MQIIKPSTILENIMLVMDDAKEFVVMVSPHYNFYKWDALLRRIENAKRRNLKMSFWAKEPENKEEKNTLKEVESLGYTARLIKGLNTRIYFNEHTAIVTSMNMLFGADNNALDIAIKTQTKQEYDEVINFYEKYIKVEGENLVYETNAFLEDLDNALMDLYPKNLRIQFDGTIIQINAKGRYKISIINEKSNCLKLNCILSDEEFEHLEKTNLGMFNKGKLSVELERGADKYHQFIWGTLYNVKTGSLDRILDTEADELKTVITGFIAAVKEMKEYIAEQEQR
jgi:hypothetical protein